MPPNFAFSFLNILRKTFFYDYTKKTGDNLIRLYADEGKKVVAADVDPDANLGLALGLTEEEVNAIVPVSKMKELAMERTAANESRTFYKMNPYVADLPDKLAKEINEMIRQMEQTETDLVNKTITNQTIKRQQQIMTRLLEHEKAEMKREKEERRESHEGKELYNISPSDLERFNKMQEKNLELFKSVPPALSPFYKNKVNDYFYKF